jgi:3-hydroxyacyl-CoA dehydrogenase
LQRGLSSIEKTYARSVASGSITQGVADQRRSAIEPVAALDGLAPCDLVVEAAFEDMAVKRTLFAALDKVLRQGAILATNTSYLDVNHIAAATERPRDVVGLHFFSPAHVMKLLEVVRASATAPDVIVTAIALAKRLGKVPVIVGVGPGFVGNRMLGARSSEMIALLLEGAEPHQVDAAFTDFGWAMGPFAMQDLAGLDIAWRNRKANGSTLPIADQLCELGHFGQKTGRGYYRYEPGSRVPQPDPDLQQLVDRTAAAMGIARRAIAAQEITERTLFPMINEGFRLLDAGIAARSSDIDLVWVHGYGFPRGLGGPMFWAERHGLAHIVARLDAWHERSGKDVFQPSGGLRARADAHPPTLTEN